MIRHSFHDTFKLAIEKIVYTHSSVGLKVFWRSQKKQYVCVYMLSVSLLRCEIQSWHYHYFIFKMVGLVLVEEINPSITKTIKKYRYDDEIWLHCVKDVS